ncbi:TPA: MTH1187 family thiamine-binding protein [Candidatus Bipolaricaulota bacterium]|nr:MTH1187 family thiamine-binding protein [Candidatus Bipolaricaulota bacterium]
MVVCEFSLVPLGAGESISAQVARCVKIVRESGLPHLLTPMGTILEGEWDQVFSVIKRCRDELRRDFNRVLISIRVDDREAPPGRLQGKVRSVEEKLVRM